MDICGCISEYKPVFASNTGVGKSKDRDQRSMSDSGSYSSPYSDSMGGYSNSSRFSSTFSSPSAGPPMPVAMSPSTPGQSLRCAVKVSLRNNSLCSKWILD
jgi:hypothetical protein